MSKKRWLIVPLCVVLCSQGSFAQTLTRKVLGINEMFRLADENSQSIQTYKTEKEVTDEALKAAKSQRLPDISASLSFSYLGDGYLWDRDFKNGQNIPMPHFGNNFALEAQQVIYAGGAISSSITLAELSQQMAALDWQKNRQEIRFLLTGYYLDLYKLNNQVQVLQKNLDLTEQVIRNMEARRTQGTALKNDITRYELQKETLKLQLAKVQDACKIMNHQLVTTLHLPAGTEIIPDSTLLDEEVKALAENDWQLLASQSNVGLQQAQLAMKMSEQKVKLERSELLPKIALVAGEHLDGPITIEVPVLDNNFNYWYVGVGIKYNLSSLFKNNKKVRQAKLNMRKAQEEYSLAQEQIENGVQANYVNFLTSFTDLRTQEKSVELEPVCISGRRRYKVVKRRKTLHNVKSDQLGYGEVHSVKELKETPLTFKSSFPFESWMADGHLVVDEKLYGCAECGMSKNDGIALQAGIPLFGAKDYAYDFIEPEKVLVKCYKDSFDCKVTFPVAQHDLRKTFADNRQELAGLGQFVSENLLIKGAELKDVYIKGYASPEGDFNYNKSLAQRRTQTLSNYISSQYPALKKAPVYRTEGVGEDWEGLKAAVSGSTLSNKDKILFIIEHNSNDTERESAIRELDNDKTYHILLEEFYPALRRTTFSLSFDVRPYTSEELPGVFETKPECLSLYEMYQLAGLYASRGENPLPVYKKAYEQFPGDIVAVLNYANALLKYGKDADGALQVLEVVREDSRVLFPMAIAYDMKGDWRKAEKLLEEAAARGCNRAKAFKAVRVNE